MTSHILVLNAGSSSIKLALFTDPGEGRDLEAAFHGEIEDIGKAQGHLHVSRLDGERLTDQPLQPTAGQLLDHKQALQILQQWLASRGIEASLTAVGHRVVHGGERWSRPVRIDPEVCAGLAELIPLAPLHQPHNLAAIEALAKLRPELPQVACFDTAFHRSNPLVAQTFALPREITASGVRRYGFHGLSYEYITEVLPQMMGERAEGRVVVAHLGNGASMCALRGGKSVATTMGFTALDGVPMGTRSGALDPGVLLYLLQERGMDAAALTDLLYHRCGLLGVSGVSHDMRSLLASGEPQAAEAVDLFVYRIGRELGSLAAALGGLDALVFTGGIGEHAVPVRARVCRDARWLGLQLDADANEAAGPRISTEASRVSAWVIPTDEELMIARHTRALLATDVELHQSCGSSAGT
jgi:acetate kinase